MRGPDYMIQLIHAMTRSLIRADELDTLENNIRNVVGTGPEERTCLREAANIIREQALAIRQGCEGELERAVQDA